MYYYKKIKNYNICYKIDFNNNNINYNNFIEFLNKINLSNIHNNNNKLNFIKKIEILYIFDFKLNNFILQLLDNNFKSYDSYIILITENDSNFKIINSLFLSNKILSYHLINNNLKEYLDRICLHSNMNIYYLINNNLSGFLIELLPKYLI